MSSIATPGRCRPWRQAISSWRSTASRARLRQFSSSRPLRATSRRPRRVKRRPRPTTRRPPAGCCCSWSTSPACASAPLAASCARRKPSSPGSRRATWLGSPIPSGVGSVEFTADRKRIVDSLMRVTGAATNRMGMSRVYISEAWALETNDTGGFQTAVDRECQGESGPNLEACRNQVEADARSLLTEASARSRATLQGMEILLRNLAQLKTPVNIVMISEGMFVARDRQSMTELGRRAAEARATIHIIRPSQSFFDIEDRGVAPLNTRFFDDSLMSEGLEQVAAQTRGSMTSVAGDGALAFDRLGRELSGYYLLGFEPTDADRTGKERRIKVEVRPRGLTVRARPTFVIRNDAAETAARSVLTPMQQLGEVLKSPLPVRGLPMRVATYSSVDSSNKVRVVITAEVGDPATTPAEWPIGMIVLDKNEKVVLNRGGTSTLAPASARGESPRLVLTSVVLDPGEYTLRVAAVDDTGRGGRDRKSTRLNS